MKEVSALGSDRMIDNGEQIEVRKEPDAEEDALRESYRTLVGQGIIRKRLDLLVFLELLRSCSDEISVCLRELS